mmetsp:Transcript_112046/g.350212  ORF Transcript_112046/g.350212 Transcript_112046/m.350212 type:complete len:246 (-) Transcript_112046:826-1563(-)
MRPWQRVQALRCTWRRRRRLRLHVFRPLEDAQRRQPHERRLGRHALHSRQGVQDFGEEPVGGQALALQVLAGGQVQPGRVVHLRARRGGGRLAHGRRRLRHGHVEGRHDGRHDGRRHGAVHGLEGRHGRHVPHGGHGHVEGHGRLRLHGQGHGQDGGRGHDEGQRHGQDDGHGHAGHGCGHGGLGRRHWRQRPTALRPAQQAEEFQLPPGHGRRYDAVQARHGMQGQQHVHRWGQRHEEDHVQIP